MPLAESHRCQRSLPKSQRFLKNLLIPTSTTASCFSPDKLTLAKFQSSYCRNISRRRSKAVTSKTRKELLLICSFVLTTNPPSTQGITTKRDVSSALRIRRQAGDHGWVFSFHPLECILPDK